MPLSARPEGLVAPMVRGFKQRHGEASPKRATRVRASDVRVARQYAVYLCAHSQQHARQFNAAFA